MLPRNHPDRIRIVFNDHRLVANAGLLLPATLAQHLGLGELVDHHLDLGSAPGRANTGDKMLTLIASALAGGDCSRRLPWPVPRLVGETRQCHVTDNSRSPQERQHQCPQSRSP